MKSTMANNVSESDKMANINKINSHKSLNKGGSDF